MIRTHQKLSILSDKQLEYNKGTRKGYLLSLRSEKSNFGGCLVRAYQRKPDGNLNNKSRLEGVYTQLSVLLLSFSHLN